MRSKRQLHRFIDDNTMHALVHALSLSRLDYCISLSCTLYNIDAPATAKSARLLCIAYHCVPLQVLYCSSYRYSGCLLTVVSTCTLMFDLYNGTAPTHAEDCATVLPIKSRYDLRGHGCISQKDPGASISLETWSGPCPSLSLPLSPPSLPSLSSSLLPFPFLPFPIPLHPYPLLSPNPTMGTGGAL